jgi:Flp pilus assembly protein CpaB
MSRRSRAFGFLLAAVLAAAAAAVIADGYGESVARGYGELRPVVVARARIGAEEPIAPAAAARQLELRRIPAPFVPPGALRALPEAVGMVPVVPIAAGSYLLAEQLHPPRVRPLRPALGRGRHPVEIEVSGAGALLAAGVQPGGSRVDVVVTTEPSGSGSGRTYVAAAAVPLIALGPGSEGESGELSAATLGLSRPQALRLIAAESFARRVTVIPRG